MELSEYLAIRRAYNLTRRTMTTSARLTFAEFAILTYLEEEGTSVLISRIAEYQQALRPTMTHRVKHLTELGLTKREKGSTDGRNVLCSITEEGAQFVRECASSISGILRSGKTLSRVRSDRVTRYVRAMGPYSLMSGDLVVLGISLADEGMETVSGLVNRLGLLQPTISMSVSALVDDGLVVRVSGMGAGAKTSGVALSEQGRAHSDELLEMVSSIVVKRRRSK